MSACSLPHDARLGDDRRVAGGDRPSHATTPCDASVADRHKPLLGAIAQIFILATVVRAASAMGLRLREDATLGPAGFASCALIAAGLHMAALIGGYAAARRLGVERARAIAVGFCGSQKTLPVSLALFDQYFKADYPLAMAPLVFFHMGQLLLDTLVAEHWKRTAPHSNP
ncbi:MAG: bile acid:sodium symporter [Gemmataceae bacterium]